jgi:hypothetical protein
VYQGRYGDICTVDDYICHADNICRRSKVAPYWFDECALCIAVTRWSLWRTKVGPEKCNLQWWSGELASGDPWEWCESRTSPIAKLRWATVVLEVAVDCVKRLLTRRRYV